MTARTYKLKPARQGSRIPASWATRKGEPVNATAAASFDLDDYFPSGASEREWFEEVHPETPAAPQKPSKPSKPSG